MPSSPNRALTALALLLASVAGGVDAIGWLTLGGLFVAHMSGNTVSLTTHVALHEWSEVGRRALAIAAFLIGLALGATSSTIAHRRSSRAGFSIALAVEAGLLLVMLVVGLATSDGHVVPRTPAFVYYVTACAAAAAMGVQSATLRRVGPARARTTYVTGVLTRWVETLVQLVASRSRSKERRALTTKAAILGAVWLSYAAGGVVSGLLAVSYGVCAVTLPLAGVFVALIVDRSLVRAGVAEAGPEDE